MTFLDQAIQEKNIRKIRSAIGSYIMADPLDRRGETSRAVRKVEAAGINIWEKHDGREFNHDRTQWDKEYFTLLQAQLMTNFSKERFEHTMQVGKEVYKEEQVAKTSKVSTQTRKYTASNQKQRSLGKLSIPRMVVMGAAVTIVAVIYYLMKE
ncbi:hypothetical protein P4S75_04940 [Anoxybacillus ayderensis]|uniref:hypothetical protein n=1 Tax=Anoxybacillus ayderensis TaxID=265546 RepID=UPI002E1A42E2|nr:hypothetical protein [Anoxybacillus ayderensis]